MRKIEPRKLGVIVCPHIFKEERPILYVCRADGDWQFLCGDGDHSDSNAHLVGVGHLTDRDPTLNELVDLQPDYEAERGSVNDPWVISECDKFEE
jgi:hypothetical protein